MYKVNGKLSKALKFFGQVVALVLGNKEIYQERGQVYTALGNNHLAVKDFNKAIEIAAGKCHFSYVLRGRALYQCKQYQDAIADFEEAMELDQDNADSFDGQGLCYQAMGDFERAISHFNRAIGREPRNN